MNPDSAIMRSTDLCSLLGTSDQSLYRWLVRPYPPHHFSSAAPRGRTYAAPEVVARLRERRARGLSGDDLARVVEFDTVSRSAMESDFLWVGEDAQGRAAAFFACLEGEETEPCTGMHEGGKERGHCLRTARHFPPWANCPPSPRHCAVCPDL